MVDKDEDTGQNKYPQSPKATREVLKTIQNTKK